MDFNIGFICKEHGPMEKAGSKNKRNICPICSKDVEKWEKPLEERPGRCGTCTKSKFKSVVYRGKQKSLRGHILRGCLYCKEVFDSDTEKIIQKGKIPQ
jgi:hypothetical protein